MVNFKYRVFLDTNVLLDVLCTPDRPSAASSRLIFEAIRTGIFEGFLTTQSILDAFYILSRQGSPSSREQKAGKGPLMFTPDAFAARLCGKDYSP